MSHYLRPARLGCHGATGQTMRNFIALHPDPSTSRRRRSVGVTIAMALLGFTACNGCNYVLEGKVVHGGHAAIVLATSDNPNLRHPGMADVMIELTLDPGSISPQPLGTQLTDRSGRFKIPIDAAGAGVLEYNIGILCRSKGFKTLYQTMPIPPKNRHLLIVMAPGSNPQSELEDIITETLRLGGQRDPR